VCENLKLQIYDSVYYNTAGCAYCSMKLARKWQCFSAKNITGKGNSESYVCNIFIDFVSCLFFFSLCT